MDFFIANIKEILIRKIVYILFCLLVYLAILITICNKNKNLPAVAIRLCLNNSSKTCPVEK